MVNHRQRLLYVRLVIDESLWRIGATDQLVDILLEMVQQAHQVGRCAGGEPEISHLLLLEAIQEAERIIDVQHVFAEMVTIVVLFQHLLHLGLIDFVFGGQFSDRISEDGV